MADCEPAYVGQPLRQSPVQGREEAAALGGRDRTARRPPGRLANRPTRPPCLKHFFPEPASASERALFARVEQWGGPPGLDQLTPELLRDLTAREDCDFASTLLHRRIVQSERHGPFLRNLSEARGPSAPPNTVAIVPGAFYRENPRTGADG